MVIFFHCCYNKTKQTSKQKENVSYVKRKFQNIWDKKFVCKLEEQVSSLHTLTVLCTLSQKQERFLFQLKSVWYFWMATDLADYKFKKKPYCPLCKRQWLILPASPQVSCQALTAGTQVQSNSWYCSRSGETKELHANFTKF